MPHTHCLPKLTLPLYAPHCRHFRYAEYFAIFAGFSDAAAMMPRDYIAIIELPLLGGARAFIAASYIHAILY